MQLRYDAHLGECVRSNRIISMKSEKGPQFFGPILVVGGCGFLGHHIVSQLLESYSVQISVLDLRTDRNRHSAVSYYDGDITSQSSVLEVLAVVKPWIIIHTASPVPFDDGNNHDAIYRKVNIDGTRNLLELAGKIGCVKAFVYTSSASVIHDTVSDLINADERWPVLGAPRQREFYSETKGIAESLVIDANRKYGDMLTVALRPAGIFGEGDTQMIPNMIRAYEKRQTKFQLGDNTNLFDFTYVGNVAHAHILAALALMSTHSLSTQPLDHERVDGEIFHITNGSPVYFWDFARMVWSTAGDRTQPSQVWIIGKDFGLILASIIEWMFWAAGGYKPNLTRKAVNYSSMTRYYNIDKAKNVLGYQPLFGLEESVVKTVQWFKEMQGTKGVGNEKKTR